MATIAQVREGITHVGQQLAAGVDLTADIVGSVLQQLVVLVDIVTRIDSDHHVLTTQVTSDVGGIKEIIANRQGALEVVMKRGGSSDREHRPRGIFVSKAVRNLSTLGTDKTRFVCGLRSL